MPNRTIELDAIPWNRLLHAHGRADDTPAHLRRLLSGDTDGLQEAFDHLHSAILHQGAPCLATGPCVAVLVDWLLAGHFDAASETRARIVRFLLQVTEVPLIWCNDMERLWELAVVDVDALLDEEDAEIERHLFGDRATGEALYARGVLGCLDVMPALLRVMGRSLDGDDPQLRVMAGCALANITRLPEYRACAQTAMARIRACADAANDSDERAAQVLTLGHIGADVAGFLDDPAASVQLCAALAPGLAGDRRANRILLEALEIHGAEVDDWFQRKPPHFAGQPRFAVVAALLERFSDFEELAGVAVTIARISHAQHVDGDWGPLLCAAFVASDGAVLTSAQYRFLDALVENESLWEPNLGNAHYWFRKAGLEYDRENCQRYLAVARPAKSR